MDLGGSDSPSKPESPTKQSLQVEKTLKSVSSTLADSKALLSKPGGPGELERENKLLNQIAGDNAAEIGKLKAKIDAVAKGKTGAAAARKEVKGVPPKERPREKRERDSSPGDAGGHSSPEAGSPRTVRAKAGGGHGRRHPPGPLPGRRQIESATGGTAAAWAEAPRFGAGLVRSTAAGAAAARGHDRARAKKAGAGAVESDLVAEDIETSAHERSPGSASEDPDGGTKTAGGVPKRPQPPGPGTPKKTASPTKGRKFVKPAAAAAPPGAPAEDDVRAQMKNYPSSALAAKKEKAEKKLEQKLWYEAQLKQELDRRFELLQEGGPEALQKVVAETAVFYVNQILIPKVLDDIGPPALPKAIVLEKKKAGRGPRAKEAADGPRAGPSATGTATARRKRPLTDAQNKEKVTMYYAETSGSEGTMPSAASSRPVSRGTDGGASSRPVSRGASDAVVEEGSRGAPSRDKERGGAGPGGGGSSRVMPEDAGGGGGVIPEDAEYVPPLAVAARQRSAQRRAGGGQKRAADSALTTGSASGGKSAREKLWARLKADWKSFSGQNTTKMEADETAAEFATPRTGGRDREAFERAQTPADGRTAYVRSKDPLRLSGPFEGTYRWRVLASRAGARQSPGHRGQGGATGVCLCCSYDQDANALIEGRVILVSG